MGSGLKIDWDFNKDKSHIVPSPTTYTQTDFATSNLKSSRGYTPGHSREVIHPTMKVNPKSKLHLL